LSGDTADLVFDFAVQPWKAAATGIVFPRMWDHDFGRVRAFLEERYPAVRLPPALSDKFEVFTVPRPSHTIRQVFVKELQAITISRFSPDRGFTIIERL